MIQLPGTVYDLDVNYRWQNANDRVSAQRAFMESDSNVARKIAQALIVANPQTSNVEIMVNMNVLPVPMRLGIGKDQPGIMDVMNNDFDREEPVNTSLWNEFSGSNGEYSGTQRPYNAIW